jgi:hypothetical protein
MMTTRDHMPTQGSTKQVSRMAFAYSSKTGLMVFTYLVDLSVVTVAIPYFFSAMRSLPTWCPGAAG